MKLYEKKPTIRIEASRGSERASVYLQDCDLDEARSFVEWLAIQRGSPIATGKRTNIVIREYFEKLGASKTISCFGISPEDLVKYIREELA